MDCDSECIKVFAFEKRPSSRLQIYRSFISFWGFKLVFILIEANGKLKYESAYIYLLLVFFIKSNLLKQNPIFYLFLTSRDHLKNYLI